MTADALSGGQTGAATHRSHEVDSTEYSSCFGRMSRPFYVTLSRRNTNLFSETPERVMTPWLEGVTKGHSPLIAERMWA
jgi:hypothetical protein